MSHPAIRLESVYKEYRIGRHFSTSAPARETLSNLVWAPWRALWGLTGRAKKPTNNKLHRFWALQDLSFSIQPGEIVGIVGRNGAGKSTLFKILSRITAPTKGRLKIWGRVATLLEVGTGFHPNLTGRENIYLSASIFGMRQKEVRRKFDAIVAYSEVEKFLDTPVRRYSSGMYVRLAFAVAAHITTDILLVDEILAVGDGDFQKKCLGTLRDGSQGGNRTVLFVSHNLQAVRSLCRRVIHIEGGKVAIDAPAEEGLRNYQRFLQKPRDLSQDAAWNRSVRGTGAAKLVTFSGKRPGEAECWRFKQGETAHFELCYQVNKTIPNLAVRLWIRSVTTGELITSTLDVLSESPVREGTTGNAELRLPQIPLRPGDYALSVELTDLERDRIFDVVDDNVGMPWLSIENQNLHTALGEGYVSIPSEVKFSKAA